MTEIRVLYHNLLGQLFKEKIAIRLWPANDPFKYCPNGIYGNCPGKPVILVPRARNGTWLNPDANLDQVGSFMDAANEMESEMIHVSHEFGHHYSAFSNYEQVRAAFDANPQAASLADRQKLMEEEELAWKKAREIMDNLKFTNWTLFDRLETESLDGYRVGFRL